MKNIRRHKTRHGFTLIELMVAVVIVGVLAMIAYPSYLSQIQKSRRTSAKTALLDLASREARYYSTNNAYTSSMATLGYSGAGTAAGSIAVPDISSHYYDLTIATNNTNTTFTGTAAPVSPQDTDTCGSFTIDNYGVKSAGSSSGCW